MSDEALAQVRRHAFTLLLEAGLRRCKIREGDRLILAVSGGADSTALLLGMRALGRLRHWSLDLHVCHVQHHLRPAAERDAEFVRRLAERWDLAWHRRDIHPAGEARNLEGSARRLRYESLSQVAEEVDADAVVTAHHRRDQLETVLMRLIRGASIGGLGGMSPRRKLASRYLIRPMLDVDPMLGRKMLELVGQEWREDETNRDTNRLRSGLRHAVLPAIDALNPSAGAKACDTAGRLRESAGLIHRIARAAEKRHVRSPTELESSIDRPVARRLPRELMTIIVRRRGLAMGTPGDRLGSRIVDKITDAARDGSGETRVFLLAGGGRVEVTAEHVRWLRG